jgi:hypothetical protein
VRLAAALWFAVSLAAQDAEPEPVLARAREKILNVTHRLPRYTCLETIHRDYFEAPKPRPHKHELTANPAPSCALVLDHPLNNLLPEGWDRVRLDVAEFNGVASPFRARLAGASVRLKDTSSRWPEDSLVFATRAGHYVIPRGFESRWRTVK